MSNLSQEDWKAALKKDASPVILDVRTEQEWEEGIIPGAVKLDIFDAHNFKGEVEKMDKAKSYFVYCRSGNRSGQACAFMNNIGFDNTYNLMGGMMEWEGETE
ncbi:MAG: rhodanese-related sulfurtransferase [Flavobacteriales bacterium]|jgi:rhodanese-related sulfurtransferase